MLYEAVSIVAQLVVSKSSFCLQPPSIGPSICNPDFGPMQRPIFCSSLVVKNTDKMSLAVVGSSPGDIICQIFIGTIWTHI